MQRKWITAALLLIISGTLFVPHARGDEADKKTVLTFSAPFEIPGRSLAAGTYVFKLFNSQGDRNIVLIYDANETHLITSVSAISASRLEPTDDTVITFDYKSANGTPLLEKWFYPGDNTGLEFVYSHHDLEFAKAAAAAASSTAD
jgi:hypothetical protein